MFLAKEHLYLIPYYDLQRLRELNLIDKKVLGLKNKCFKDYREVIRKWKKSNKWLIIIELISNKVIIFATSCLR